MNGAFLFHKAFEELAIWVEFSQTKVLYCIDCLYCDEKEVLYEPSYYIPLYDYHQHVMSVAISACAGLKGKSYAYSEKNSNSGYNMPRYKLVQMGA